MNNFYYSIILISLLINFITLYFISYLSNKLRLLDMAKNKIHLKDTPKFGFFIFLNLSFFLLIFSFYNDLNYEGIHITLFIFSFLILGYFDDRNNLSVIFRFLVSSILIIIFYLYYPGFLYVSQLFPYSLNLFLLVFFTLGFIHLINITDGLNGLVPSLFLYSCLYYLLKGYNEFNNLHQLLIVLSIFGMGVFFIPNLFGKCFLGNSGSYLVAIIVTILYSKLYSIGVVEYSDILLIFYIPLLDGIRVTLKRIINKKNPFEGDLTHLHHIIRNNKILILIYFLIIYLPSTINFWYDDFTIYLSILFFITYIIFYKFVIRKTTY